MIFGDADQRLRSGASPRAVADWLVTVGLDDRVAHELVAVLIGKPPDVVPASVFPLQIAVRPTGQDLFDAMTEPEQDAMFGVDVAAALRAGTVKLSDLVKPAPMKTEPDFITAKTPADLGLQPKDS